MEIPDKRDHEFPHFLTECMTGTIEKRRKKIQGTGFKEFLQDLRIT